MADISLLSILSLVTLVLVLGFGIHQLVKVRGSQARRGEHPGGVAGPERPD